MELDLKKMTDRELLLIMATHVVEKQPEVKRKILTSLLAEKLFNLASTKLKSKHELDELITGGWKLVATIDYNDEKICTSSDYVDGASPMNQHVVDTDGFGKRLSSAADALAEKIASTYDLERVGDVEAEIQLKPRRIGL